MDLLGSEAPICPDAADANDDGTIDISDAISILGTVFGESKLIAVPYPRRGTDPSLDSLGTCRS